MSPDAVAPDVRVWRHRDRVAAVGDSARTALVDLDDPTHPPRILLGPAAAVWQALDGRRDLAALADRVAAQFDLTGPDVADDVAAFVDALAADGLLEEARR